tara:strand:- start:2983 stop:3642 length:660 start_codon:yes stop_codon:yes gene_type:complete
MLSLLSIIIMLLTKTTSGFSSIPRRTFILASLSSKPLYNKILSGSDEENSLIHNIKNHIYYSGPLTDESIFAITTNVLTLQNMDNDNNEINLHIKSQGGSLLPTLGLVDIIRTSDIPINTFIDGYAASAATLISIVGANRFINKHGVMLIHQLKMGADYSKYNEIKDFSENADTLMNIVKNLYLEYSNLDEKKLDYLLDHDLWLNSTVSKKYGLVDIII